MTREELFNSKKIAIQKLIEEGMDGYAASDGFDACTDIMWPEIERQQKSMTTGDRNWNQLLEQKDKYEDQVYHMSRKIEELEFQVERMENNEKILLQNQSDTVLKNEQLKKENEKLQAKLYFLAGVLSTHDGFTDKTLDQIFEWADKEMEK